MKTFQYVVKDELGIHARPAGLLVAEAKKFNSRIMVKKEDREVDATRIMSVMALGVKKDQMVTVTVEGEDENEAFAAIKKFFEEQL